MAQRNIPSTVFVYEDPNGYTDITTSKNRLLKLKPGDTPDDRDIRQSIRDLGKYVNAVDCAGYLNNNTGEVWVSPKAKKIIFEATKWANP